MPHNKTKKKKTTLQTSEHACLHGKNGSLFDKKKYILHDGCCILHDWSSQQTIC